MQKHLNTHKFAATSLLERIFLNGKVSSSLAVLVTLILVGFSHQAAAQTTKFIRDFVIINGKRYYTVSDSSSGSAFQSASLGPFPRTGGPITLTGEANVTNRLEDNFTSIQLLYRVYQQPTGGAPAPDIATVPYVPLSLAYQQASATPTSSQWLNNTTKPNLLSYTSGPPEPATYVLEVLFQGTVSDVAGNSSKIFDPGTGGTYTATFVVSGNTPPTQWKGTSNGDWYTAGNWSTNVVPNQYTDVTIPTNSTGQYPTISGDVSQVASVRSLVIGKTLDAQKNPAVGLTVVGQLSIFGNFQTSPGRFKQNAGSGGRVILAGSTPQTIAGTPTFTDLVIQGGSTKTLTNNITIQNTLTFNENPDGTGGGILATLSGDDTDTGNFYVQLSGQNTRVSGETENSYVMGTLRSTQTVSNVPNDFGNIGVQLTANGPSPGTTTATRVYRIYNGVGTSVSIQRSFIFLPGQDIQNFSLAFHYLNADLNGIQAPNLILFRTESGGIPFEPLYKTTLDVTNKVLNKVGITGTLAATFTLGDNSNPLPVTLISFTAVAQGSDAVLNWTTAQEVNSKGFEAQVSSDGTAFHTLGFVASAAPNSSKTHVYQYRDAAPGKQGTRYYRLRQVDLDGKESFFGPQAVTFGASALASVQGYPNPFGSEINLALQTTTAGPASVSVFDGVGRQVRLVQPTLAVGASNLRLGDLQNLPHGLYMVQVRYADGQTQRLKLVKE